jgi:hypothetical protein
MVEDEATLAIQHKDLSNHLSLMLQAPFTLNPKNLISEPTLPHHQP